MRTHALHFNIQDRNFVASLLSMRKSKDWLALNQNNVDRHIYPGTCFSEVAL
jgi:hypothetical protein